MSDADKPSKTSTGGFNRGEAYTAGPRPGARSGASSGGFAPPIASPSALIAFAVVAIAAYVFVGSILAALALGVLAFVLVKLMSRKGSSRRIVAEEAPLGVDRAAVQATLDAAEADLQAIDAAAEGLASRGLAAPLREMTAAAREVLDEIAQDPGDLSRARKFVKVYVPSARAAVEKFAAFEATDADLEARFRALAGEMKATAERQAETLRRDEKIDLEVEMEVLAERLKQ